nr:bulb-type lectin domain-containing protein [Tanacetum cinerariifolium]
MDADYVQLDYDTIGLKGDFLVEGIDKGNWNKIWLAVQHALLEECLKKQMRRWQRKKYSRFKMHILKKYFQEFITSTTNEGRYSADTNLIKQEVKIPLKSSKGKRLNNDKGNSECIMWAGLDIDSDQDTYSGNKDTRQLTVNSFEGSIRFMKLANNNKVVLKHREIFRECFKSILKWFHNTYIEGDVTKLMPLTIGGNEICLFYLYKLVKCFGGYERLNYKKKWDEVSLGFRFSGLYGLRYEHQAGKGRLELHLMKTSEEDSLPSITLGDECNANMAFDSRPTKDVLPWSGNANMAFDLQLTEDVLSWLDLKNSGILLNNHNGMATRTKEWIFALLGTEARRICHAGRLSRKDRGYQKRKYVQTCGLSRMDRTYDRGHQKGKYDRTCGASRKDRAYDHGYQKKNMSGRAEYRGRTGPMTVDTKKKNMFGHAKRHGRTEPMTTDSKIENMTRHSERHGRTDPMTADTKKESMSRRSEYRGRTGPMTADTKKENMSGHAKCHRRTEPITADSKKENMSGRA